MTTENTPEKPNNKEVSTNKAKQPARVFSADASPTEASVPEQLAPPAKKIKKKKSLPRRIFSWFWMTLVAFLAVAAFMTNTDGGSRRLLNFLTHGQSIISYQYQSGNFFDGLTLNNIKVTLPVVDVHVEKAVLKIGWRGVVRRQLHFRYAELQKLEIIKKTPPSDKPFEFAHLKLPFSLRFDRGFVHGLDIHLHPGSTVHFKEIALNKAVWSGDELSLKDSSMDMGYLRTEHVTGTIKFYDKYPLNVDGQLIIPSIHSIHMDTIYVAGRGTLDTIYAGLTTLTPDLMTASGIVHPVRRDSPFKATLKWKDYHWPFAQAQKLFSKQGQAVVNGGSRGLDITLNSDLAGKDVPPAQLLATGYVEYVKGLTIQALHGQVMGGNVQAQGTLNWQHHLNWQMIANLAGMNAKDKTIPASIQPYLPSDKVDGKLFSAGQLSSESSKLYTALKLSNGETWLAGIARTGSIGNNHLPMAIDARWENLNRKLPSIGYLNSPDGRLLMQMKQQSLTANMSASIVQSEQGIFPGGKYSAALTKKDNQLNLTDVVYSGLAGDLSGTATVLLPKAKQPLEWQAQLHTQGFDPSKINKAVPFNRLTGVINAQGHAAPNQHLITLKDTRLLASMPASQGQAAKTVELSGNTNAALLFYPPVDAKLTTAKSQPSGLKSFAVQFTGDLKAPNTPTGALLIKVSGTPKLINIDQFEHHGAAGNINANGLVDLTDGPAWQVRGVLDQFNPGFFIAGYGGQVSGQFNTTGHWQTNRRDFQLNNLNLHGVVKNQPVIGQGAINVVFNPASKTGAGLWPTQFNAQNLQLSFAGNRLLANGDSRRLLVDINAPALYQLYPGLKGNVVGQISLTGSQQAPDAAVDIQVKQLSYNDIFTVEKASLTGRVPQLGHLPSQLIFNMQNLRRGSHIIQQASILLAGTQTAHVLQLTGTNALSNFSVQLAGGLQHGDWLGQIQKGKFISKHASLLQDRPATLVYRGVDKAVYVDRHCWQGNGSSLCLTDPLLASAKKGVVSLQLNNLDIGSFQAFMPQGLAWTGKMYGHAKTTWAANSAPTLDAQMYTDNGTIGLAPDDPQDAPLTLPYQRLSLNATTQLDGIKLRFDAKTPNIGAGYIDATINPHVAPKTINGALVLTDVQLSVFKPFFPGMRALNGVASLAGGMSGPLTGPDFYGDFKLKDGQVVMNNLPVNLNRINLHSTIEGTKAALKGDFYSGQGHGNINGDASWNATPVINLSLDGDKLLIRQAPMITAKVTPKLSAQIYPTLHQVSVNGNIDIPSAVAAMPESSADYSAKSADVRVVRSDQLNNIAVMKAAKPWAINADIAITLGNDVYFRGFGSSIPLGGQLNLTQRGLESGMRGLGVIGVKQNVNVEAFGQRMQLNRGIARFNGNILQPTIEIDASKSISSRTVGMRITGRASNPNIAVYNDAGLSEQEALNALLTGHISSATTTVSNTAGLKSDVNNTIAAAGLSLGLGGFNKLTNQVGRTVGLNALTLNAEGVGDDTQVNLTGYITPDLFLRYGVGVFTPVNRLTLRYQVNRRLYVEASSALDRAIDMFYNWRF